MRDMYTCVTVYSNSIFALKINLSNDYPQFSSMLVTIEGVLMVAPDYL